MVRRLATELNKWGHKFNHKVNAAWNTQIVGDKMSLLVAHYMPSLLYWYMTVLVPHLQSCSSNRVWCFQPNGYWHYEKIDLDCKPRSKQYELSYCLTLCFKCSISCSGFMVSCWPICYWLWKITTSHALFICWKGCYFQPSRDTYTSIFVYIAIYAFQSIPSICAGSEGGNATGSFGIWFQGLDGHVFKLGILTSGTREPICEHKYKCSHMAGFRRLLCACNTTKLHCQEPPLDSLPWASGERSFPAWCSWLQWWCCPAPYSGWHKNGICKVGQMDSAVRPRQHWVSMLITFDTCLTSMRACH